MLIAGNASSSLLFNTDTVLSRFFEHVAVPEHPGSVLQIPALSVVIVWHSMCFRHDHAVS